MSPPQKSSAASPATLDAIRHLARLGVRGWVLIALLLGVIYLANQFLLDSSPTPSPAGGTAAASNAAAPAGGPGEQPPPADEFGADPRGPRATPPRKVPRRDSTPPRATTPPADPPRTEPPPPRRTYAVVTVTFRTKSGEAKVDLEPGSVLARTDGKGLVLAERLRGGEKILTNCKATGAATIVAAKVDRVTDVRPPPKCVPATIDPFVEKVTVRNFGRPVPAAAPKGVVDLSETLARIAAGEAFPHRNDGSTFGNREGRLPRKPRSYYKEYVHPTPGVNGPGPQRLVIGAGGDVWYTPDHYDSFRAVANS